MSDDGDDCIHGLAPLTCSLCVRPDKASVPKARPVSRNASTNGRRTPENSTSYFGHSWPVWFEMRDAGIAHIRSCAQHRQTTTYGAVWAAVEGRLGQNLGNSWRQLPNLLGHISEHVYDESGVLLTALVIYEEGDDSRGDGFFRLAASVGAIRQEHSPPVGVPWLGMTSDQRDFWEAQVAAVFAWANGPDKVPGEAHKAQ
jgi:hypothetical protein